MLGVGSRANRKPTHDFSIPVNTEFCYLSPFGRNLSGGGGSFGGLGNTNTNICLSRSSSSLVLMLSKPSR